jgi:ABC-type Na+ efflux pump permease subunit
VGDEVASGSGVLSDESMEVADADDDALTRADALADAGVDVTVEAVAEDDAEEDVDDEGSTVGSVFVNSSGLHSSGMPSAASSESVDASAGVVPTSDAMIAMQDAAMTIRRTRVTRALALAITRKTSPRHS